MEALVRGTPLRSSAADTSVSSGKSAVRRQRSQYAACAPGSPNISRSAALSASASARSVEMAPSASRASLTGSASMPGTINVTRCQAISDGFERRDLFFEVVDAHAPADERRVVHELLVQRDVGLDALDHHFPERHAHARD